MTQSFTLLGDSTCARQEDVLDFGRIARELRGVICASRDCTPFTSASRPSGGWARARTTPSRRRTARSLNAELVDEVDDLLAALHRLLVRSEPQLQAVVSP